MVASASKIESGVGGVGWDLAQGLVGIGASCLDWYGGVNHLPSTASNQSKPT